MNRINRRELLATGAGALAACTLGGYVAYAQDHKPYRVGVIGCGWYGKNDVLRLIQVAPGVEIVSLCDPDRQMRAGAAEIVAQRQASKKQPTLFGDFREMFKEKDLDIVIVATPDHWHALATIAAIGAGAHVYCQKPVGVDVLEGEAMLAAARKHGKVVQVGTQRRSTPHLIEAKRRFVDSGALGTIAHAEICCYYHMRANGDPPVQPVPDFFDYEMWTGPAPLRPFDGLPHRRWWRTFMEYGNGIVGDMCIHMLDTVRWMLGLAWPTRITSTGGILVQKGGKSNITDTQTAVFEFPALNVIWQHRTWGTPPDPQYPWAIFLYGERGTLKASPMAYDFLPGPGSEEKALHADAVYEKEKYPEDVTEPDIELHAAPATRLHLKNFLAAIETRGQTKPVADIEQAHISTASCVLANISAKLGGRPMSYDRAKREVSGDAEATKLLRRPYRAPWAHPAEGLA